MKAGFADIYAGGRSYIASFAGLVFEGAEKGDAVCQQILEKGSDDLAELTWAAEKHFDGEFTIVMSGGIFAYFRHYAEMVRKKSTPRAKMITQKSPPVYGSLVEACHQCGITLTEDVWNWFMKQYIDELKKP
jgi:N-acetylglucosamine kinase-like BadF-type ATPase